MLNLVPYLIKLSISLTVVYLFYQLLLRRLTFYNSNRWYLLLYSMTCFIIPFVDITALFTQPELQQSAIVQYIPSIERITDTQTKAPVTSVTFSMNIMYMVIVIAGMIFMLIRCLVQFWSLFRMRAKAKLLYDSTVKLYHIDKPVIPFSFGNAIYINQNQHSQQELSDIIRHEFIHVKQRHTIDIIWAELLCIMNWYNPFAWLLRRAIRQNLEFIADHQVLQTGLDRKQYQYLLLKVIGTAEYSIASNFNFSSLKKRIAMMNKTKSAKVHLLRFLFILPLLAVILLAFRNVVQQRQQPVQQPVPATAPEIITDTVITDTAYAMANETPIGNYVRDRVAHSISRVEIDTVPAKTADTAARKVIPLPEDISSIEVNKGKSSITMTFKDGHSETYVITDPEDRKKFKDKYGGELPTPAAAPQPPVTFVAPGIALTPVVPVSPAPPPVEKMGVTAPSKPVVPVKPGNLKEVVLVGKTTPIVIAEGRPPGSPDNDDCFNEKGYCITVADNGGERVVIVKNRKMKIVEATSLEDWNSNKRYEDKYGPLPAVKKTLKLSKPVTSKNTLRLEPTGLIDPNAELEPEVSKQQKVSSQIEALIDQHTSKAVIEQLDKRLQQHGLSLSIYDLQYSDGLLTNISGRLNRNDGKGYVSFTSDDLSKDKIKLTSTRYINGNLIFGVRPVK